VTGQRLPAAAAPGAAEWSRSARYELPAPVTFGNLVTLRREARRQIDEAPGAIEISFGGREHSGSAGVALMMGLFRYAHGAGKALRFVAVPADLRNIIDLAELDEVLPVAEEAPEGVAAATPSSADGQHDGRRGGPQNV
jgi:phospholipid transport system transporter-binding protein